MNAVDGFNEIAAQLNYPMLIVTAGTAATEMAGCLVGFHTQCSIDPPRILVCISRLNRTYEVATRNELLGVHFLDAEDHSLAALFGERTGDSSDKFESCSWESRRGVPILPGVKAWVIGRVLERVDLGDHVGHLLEPVEAHLTGDLHQLAFQQVKDMEPGHP